jgi:hypothetical protein
VPRRYHSGISVNREPRQAPDLVAATPAAIVARSSAVTSSQSIVSSAITQRISTTF